MHRIMSALIMAAAPFAAHAAGPHEASSAHSRVASSDHHVETNTIRTVVFDTENDAGAPDAVRVVKIAARVTRADGSPASGAVVVSSAGGKGVADADGVAHLAVSLAPDAESVHVTAAATERGVTSTGSVRAFVVGKAGRIDAGVITLAERGECAPEWVPTFGGQPGVGGMVRALTVFDDGSGPALYAAGGFNTAGGVRANRVVKWDGASWTPLGSGMNSSVDALTVFDDGMGPALYAGGAFSTAGGESANQIAKWDGASWSPLGSGMSGASPAVYALTVFDDGSGGGPALYAGGNFTAAGGVEANHIARWDGDSWSPLGSGMNDQVNALTVVDVGSGSGPALYAGGEFTSASGVPANFIAKWDGASWSSLGSGIGGLVSALTNFDDGSGPALYAGGEFLTAGGETVNHIAKWDGTSWSPLGSGVSGISISTVFALTVFDDGSGPALYAGGWFTAAGGAPANRIARWDGDSWSPMGIGMSNSGVFALTVFDDGSGSGPALFAGGSFFTSGGETVNRIAKWEGASWSPLGSGMTNQVNAFAVFDDGSGPALYAGGEFTSVSGMPANFVAKWDGASWSPLGSGVDNTIVGVVALTVYDDGSGPALYAGGQFTTAGGVEANRIAKWDGASWSPLGSGMSHMVRTLTVFDDGSGGGPALIAGGSFTTAGGLEVNHIARWDGVSWSPMGSGMNHSVRALTVFDDGSGGGPALYAGGQFTTAGGVSANRIARWDGVSWSPLGSVTNSNVHALTVFDDGSGGGPALYAGGQFITAGGLEVNRIAKWDGVSWSPMGSGMNNTVLALTVFDDGTGAGPALYAGGSFTTAGGVAASRIAKWDGASWSPLESGVFGGTQLVRALTVFNDGSGLALYAGGEFTTSPAGDSYLARWQGCPAVLCPWDLTGDGSVGSADLAFVLGLWGNPYGSSHLADMLGNWGPCP